jgi:tRNA threonylcarbamoyladenosine biosynthesis protein TsaE
MFPDASVHSRSPAQTQELARALGELLAGGDVVALSGELGAGKTCFTQGLAVGLGVHGGVPVTSPTFTLIGQYPGRVEMRHADFYRVESYARLEAAGFDDLLDGHGVLVVEWPERFIEALPAERIEIRIELVPELGDEVRRIRVRALGERPAEICRRWQARWP